MQTPQASPKCDGHKTAIGCRGAASSTNAIAARIALECLSHGGNAFDAAVTAGLALQVLEPHMSGFGGELVGLLKRGSETAPTVICGQGTAPGCATSRSYRSLGLKLIPERGLLASVVPGAFAAWMNILRDYGTKDLASTLQPCIQLAEQGVRMTAECSRYVKVVEKLMQTRWPSSAAMYLPSDGIVRNPQLARTLQGISNSVIQSSSDREMQIENAKQIFYRGFVAEEIGRFVRASGDLGVYADSAGLGVCESDMTNWDATYERPVFFSFRDYVLYKPGFWSQGPVLLQALSLVEASERDVWTLTEESELHLVIELMKLAFADREAWYGDNVEAELVREDLLQTSYGRERIRLVGQGASKELRPGVLNGRRATIPDVVSAARPRQESGGAIEKDTCHLNVADRCNNVVSITVSGGWLQGSPVIPSLGFSLSTRAQMFWLQEGLASSLAPFHRPRTTLTPTLAARASGALLAFGCKGADYSDQWSLQFFLRVATAKADLQTAMDAPMFGSEHWHDSAFPRAARLGRVTLDQNYSSFGHSLGERGHLVKFLPTDRMGRICALESDNGRLTAAATSKLPQAGAFAF
jgi:gamma-glutamyltranspeptidase/glutathione hydrolase